MIIKFLYIILVLRLKRKKGNEKIQFSFPYRKILCNCESIGLHNIDFTVI